MTAIHPKNNVKKNEKNNIYIYIYIYIIICIINVTKMVFVETVLTVSGCIMIVRFRIV